MTSTRISRREFLQLGAGATAGVAIAGSAMGTFLFTEEAQAVTSAVRLTPFLDELPIPPALTGASQNLTISQTPYFFHDRWKNAPIPVWGYNGGAKTDGYLGPTIVAQRGTQTTVDYANALPRKHLLNVDPTLNQMKGKPVNSRILTHLHGGHIEGLDDGNPYAGGRLPSGQTVPDFLSGQTQRVRYRNDQEAAHIWYHDHALGITRLNVMAGLAGVYLLRDDVDDGQGGNFPDGNKLPSGDYEVPLVIQDRAFAKDGRIKYPAQWTPEFFGDVVCVNGKAWPFKNVEPRKYRMRILNGSNSRFYNLQLTDGAGNVTEATMTQIGTDGGLLQAQVPINSLVIAPGERADVVFDFTNVTDPNREVLLIDTPLPPTTVSPATPLANNGRIMLFKVGTEVTVPDGPLPAQLRETPFSVPPGTQVGAPRERFLTLEERLAGPVPTALVLNGMRFGEVNAQGNRIVTEQPNFGDTEVWTLINVSAASWIGLIRILSTFGSAALAGYTIGIRIIIFALLPSWGLCNAAATMVGQALGAKKPERAEASVWMAGNYNLLFLGAIGLAFVLFARPLIALFTADPEVQRYGVDCLRVIAAGFLFYAHGMVITQSFNGAGDTATPTWINLFVFWLWEIPLAYVLAVTFGMGPHGVFLAVAVAFSTLALVSAVIFRRGHWKTRVV